MKEKGNKLGNIRNPYQYGVSVNERFIYEKCGRLVMPQLAQSVINFGYFYINCETTNNQVVVLNSIFLKRFSMTWQSYCVFS